MRRVIFSMIFLLLGNCTLAENIQEKEGRKYGENYVPNPVEYYDTATIQRLEDFYQTDPIDYKYLSTIYKGNLKLRSAESIKLNWEKARKLALTEWEFQKEERGWERFGISERPKLITDLTNTKFYRYYEFFVLDDGIIKGSIVIPAYKKTENFFTTEVRVYNSDQKTFTSYPTKWGEFAASQFPKIKIEKGSNVDKAFDEIYDTILEINKITEYDIYYKQISEELTNSNLLPVSSSLVSNLIKEETTSKFSNNMTDTKISAVYKVVSDGSDGKYGGNGSGRRELDIDATQKKLELCRKKEEEKLNTLLKKSYDQYSKPITDDINKNIAKNIADENFEKERLARRNEFIDKTKIAYEKSVYIWQTNFLVEMGNSTAQKVIADGYSILFWDELEKEFNKENSITRVAPIIPVLVGAGAGAILGATGYFSYTYTSGSEFSIKELIKSVVLTAAVGGFVPLIPQASGVIIATKLLTTSLFKDMVFTTLSYGVAGIANRSLGLTDALGASTFGTVGASVSAFFTKNPIAIWNALGSIFLSPFLLLYDVNTKNKAKKELEYEEIPEVSNITGAHTPSSGGVSGGGQSGNSNPPDFNVENNNKVNHYDGHC